MRLFEASIFKNGFLEIRMSNSGMDTMRLFLLGLFLVGGMACQSSTDSTVSSESATFENAKVKRIWLQHITEETVGVALQQDCHPTYFQANNMQSRRGIVVFFHGFTACPQQYFRLGKRLASAGFDVFLPLMPGQGRVPVADVKQDGRDLPFGIGADINDNGANDRYDHFVSRMNELAAAASGERIIVGLSGGGSLATGAAYEVRGQNIWSRLLLYAPYFDIPGTTKTLASVVNVFRPQFVNDWGEACRYNRDDPDGGGRDGYCSLPVGAVYAMKTYGRMIADRIIHQGRAVNQQNETVMTLPVQFAGVEYDPTADNRRMHQVFQSLPNARFCLFPKGVPHSMINPANDEPNLDPYWIPSLDRDSMNFILHGEWFRTSGPSLEEAPFGIETNLCHHQDVGF